MEPENADEFYSETLVRLPNLALRYEPPKLPKPPKTRAQLGIPEKRFVFLSTQSIFKYLPQHDDVYPIIALQAPEACFVFISNQSIQATQRFQNRLAAAFRRHGLKADDYCYFSPKLKFMDFLSLNMAADVLLDSIEWSGGKTTLEAISCGLPVVTCPGRFMRGRHAYAMLRMMEVTATVCQDKSEYCATAAHLANDPVFFQHTKKQFLTNRYQLYGDKDFMSALENFYKAVVGQKPIPMSQ